LTTARNVISIPPRTIATLMGPTASGKTDLALRIADRLPVDIISVDSAMVYRGMDVGTAKPSRDVLARHPHELIDIRDPAQAYSAGEFVADARACVVASLERGRLPLLVGGTMLYFKAFRGGIAELPVAAPEIRAMLDARARREGLAALHVELARIDPIAAAVIHPNNPQRLLRALEVHAASGSPISEFWARQRRGGVADGLDCRLLEFALEPPRTANYATIAQRFADMLAAGFLDEVHALMARGDLAPTLPSMRAVGYRQAWQHLSGDIDRETMVDRATAATRQLAKRQRTWLRSWPEKIVLNDAVEANLDSFLQSLLSNRIVRRSR
jgi:tRNA dimethylallyltransferase